MSVKRTIHYAILASLLITAGYYSIYGPTGIKQYKNLCRQIACEVDEISRLKKEVSNLNNKIRLWKEDPFEKERVGRVDLLLACSNEIIYLTS